MAQSMEDRIREWEGLAVVTRYDRAVDAWIFVALHDRTLGPPTGGCRMKVYDRPEDGLTDALRLARGMTYKWAGVDMPFGGGKSVIALSRPLKEEEREHILTSFGELLEALNGAYWTGEDLGTTPSDMAVVARTSRYVHGAGPDGGEPIDPGPYTARGVLAGIQGALEHAVGTPEPEGRSILIQGVGHVGAPLARLLDERGARLLLTDMDGERAAALAREVGGEVVEPERAFDTSCDVFAPCAVGAVLNRETIPRLRCRIVSGAANNQLEGPEDAARLHDRGILYVPDYILNAGGAIALPLLREGRPEAEIFERIDGIRATVLTLLEEAGERGTSPQDAADRLVRRRLGRTGPARPSR